MKLLKVLSFTLILIVSSYGQASDPAPAGLRKMEKTDREVAGLTGPVKSISSESVDYSGDKIVGEGFMKVLGDLVTYDEMGRETNRKPMSDFGESMGTISRIFDKAGLLKEEIWVDGKGRLKKKDVYAFDAGRLVQIDTYDGKLKVIEKTVKEYNSKGRLQTEIYYDPVKPAAQTVFKYDDKGNQIEATFFMADGSKAIAPVGPCLGAHRVTYQYNERGQMIARGIFETDGTEKKNFRFTYDNSGNVSQYLSESPSSTVTFTYTYEFDSRGNWIKRIANGRSLEKGTTVFGDTPTPYLTTSVTTRQIQYH